MTPERQNFERQLGAIRQDAHSLVTSLREDQFNWQPAPGRWSIGEHLAHLNQCLRVIMPALDRAIAKGRAKGLTGQGPFNYGWFGNWMVRSFEPPVTRRYRTQRVFVPPPAPHVPARVLAEFGAVRDELSARLAQAEGLDWGRFRVVSPASPLFRLRFGGYVAFVLAHDRRHLWTARRMPEQPGYPR